MDWKDIAGVVGKMAPIIGTALGGPLGGAAGALLSAGLGCANTPDAVSQVIATNPDAAVKLQQILSDQAVALEQINAATEQAEIAALTATNQATAATMQSEAKSEHWMQWSWRPFIGFASGLAFFVFAGFVCYLSYMAILGGEPNAMTMIPQLVGSMSALFGAFSLPILGVASYHRGVAKVEDIKNQRSAK